MVQVINIFVEKYIILSPKLQKLKKWWSFFIQRAKKVVSNSPGLVDFAIGLENSVFNLPNRQVMFFEEFELQKNCEINSSCQKVFGASWNDIWASKN